MSAERKIDFLYESAEQVEIAFYKAFGEGDFLLMESLFADSGVSSTHPNNSTIIGRKKVVDNWEFLLEGIPQTTINREVLSVTKAPGIEIHLVLESFVADVITGELSEVYATNVYVLQENGWRLQTQHASLPKQASFNTEFFYKDKNVMSMQMSKSLN
ncbi:nuclear transport factor 2 family protein [Cocleimonas sp. KMM 6892]|jgi:hypothetical protein|uniref:YybH family protein n=1 Tax=unclassified Cocleimonas TaxID=2639732 RepID=UPI002DBBC995|nr:MULTISPECIES: nuclear transport factor 2 family protein [unclassified Cocleimonas]MEB8433588.1 nuclear transport factor 2 family protein [Cocleimonas sp. KMM 6892]MEC4716399.1 nuclear transport factor 2 family protein [Cocleimonas sp. KMM 6895]MEC4745708.1 nuclear transport factor 2 family protein [Cocleimonas sp. KMM 6896]